MKDDCGVEQYPDSITLADISRHIDELREHIATLTTEKAELVKAHNEWFNEAERLSGENATLTAERDETRSIAEGECARAEQHLKMREEAEAERDALLADLTALARAGDALSMLFEAHWTVKDTAEAVHEAVANWKAVMARPGVQAVLEDKGGDADGEEKAR